MKKAPTILSLRLTHFGREMTNVATLSASVAQHNASRSRVHVARGLVRSAGVVFVLMTYTSRETI